MQDEVLRRRIAVRGWSYNNFTCYLLEVGLTPYWIGEVFDIAMAVISYWLHHEKLSRPVDSFFLTMRKLYMTHGIKISDLF